MVNVLVCVKRVPDSSSQVLLTADEQAVDGRIAGYTMSPHEECAVELAVQLAAATGGAATALTLGAERGRRAAPQCPRRWDARLRSTSWPMPSLLRPADVAREIAAVGEGARRARAEAST